MNKVIFGFVKYKFHNVKKIENKTISTSFEKIIYFKNKRVVFLYYEVRADGLFFTNRYIFGKKRTIIKYLINSNFCEKKFKLKLIKEYPECVI